MPGSKNIHRRDFLNTTLKGIATLSFGNLLTFDGCTSKARHPNLIYIFADQWRACDTGYAGTPVIRTPNLDQLARTSINFTTAISGCPVCSPYRASLMTGQYWLNHGIFYNDKPLNPDLQSIAKVYLEAGYDTAYIGKWHLNGHPKGGTVAQGRSVPVPKERRHGFEFWKVNECTHNYNDSIYYDENNTRHTWDGYDAIAQTKAAQQYIRDHAAGKPFILFLSWGPPHDPYRTAPENYRQLFDSVQLSLRPNVPAALTAKAREDIAGYYAHIAALDECVGVITRMIKEAGIADDTILVFTSDHGDMLYCHGQTNKQKSWDESIRVPFLLRYPALHGQKGRVIDMPINTPDIMPTLLGLCHLAIPASVQGQDFSGVIRGVQEPGNEAALLACPVPFHQWSYQQGGREYRGVRTRQHTYVRDLNGPWLLYDNDADPFQLNNLVNTPDSRDIQVYLDDLLNRKLQEAGDEFLAGPVYMERWDYDWDGSDRPS